MQIEKLLKQPNALPSAPKVVRQLIETFDQEDVDMVRVAALIQEDPVLTAKLLKMANSAFFGLTRSVTNAREALNVMGLMKVRALVIAASLGDGFHCVGGVNLNQFWRYSLTRSVPMLDLKRARAEKGLFGYHYADVGAALAREWRFPKRMVQAIEHQVAPFDNDIYEPIAGVIHIASWRARAQELDLRAELLINTYPDPVGLALGIDPDIVIGEEIPALTRESESEEAA